MIGAPLKIGTSGRPVSLATNLLLAPVAGYCDLAFRVVVREVSAARGPGLVGAGVGLACTDLLSPQGLLRGTATSLDLAQTNHLDKPVGMQLYGGDGDILAEGARWAVRHGATVVDINMGCPVDKVTKKDGGSKLLCHPESTVRMAERVVRAVEHESGGAVPVTAKMRLGWDWTKTDAERAAAPDSAPALASALVGVGIAMITVHGRYAQQRFLGAVRRDGIRDVVEAVRAADRARRVPVIGNGDVQTAGDALSMMRETGCDGVMIGRAAFSAPWIFREAWALQTLGADAAFTSEPTLEEKVAIIRRYLDLMVEYRDERYAMTHIRRRITWFGKRLGPCKPLKEAVRTAVAPADVRVLLDRFAAGDPSLRRYSAADIGDEIDAEPAAMA